MNLQYLKVRLWKLNKNPSEKTDYADMRQIASKMVCVKHYKYLII